MFKKSIEAKALQRLSGADRKKLKRSLKERFMLATDADLDPILPPKVEITIARLPNRAHVYSIEGGLPMIFDVDGRGSELFPTVFALWRVPDLLPAFILKGGEVSRFIIGGADLMFPGIAIPSDGFPSFLAGKPWSVKVPGNNAPIAVGSTMLSSIEAVKAGLHGKALHVLHFYRDSLWESVEGQLVPNAGFLEDMVVEDPSLLESTTVQQAYFDEAEIDTEKAHDSETNETPEEEVIYEHQTDLEQRSCGSQHVECNISDELTSHIGTLNVADKVPTTSAEENANDKDQHVLSTEEVDALLDKCLLQALHTTIKDKDLPMSGSALWSSHVLPCRPVGVTLDIKRSSHKKLSKWLQSKSSGGLISAKEDKHKKEVILMSINRTHVDYTSFKPEKRTSATAGEITDTMKTGQQIKGKLELVEVYKSTTHVNPILVAVGADTGKYFSAPEVSEIVFSYVEKEKLVKPTDKALVILDATLCDALYKGTVKKGSSYPTEIHKKDLSATFLNRMQVHHVVVRDDKSTVRKGSAKPVQIMTERRQGNKKVTRLSGLETFLVDVESLSSEIQKKFACSTSVAELPGKKGQHELLVQGGVIDDLAKHLVDHYGIPKRYIEVFDKTKR